jgi:RNA polymerase sigma factor (sigma-70 family)
VPGLETVGGISADLRLQAERTLLEALPLVDEVVRFVRRRNGLTVAEADDLRSLVRVRLVEDDYAVIRKFQNRSTLRTYLTVVIQRICLDEWIRQRGKWRPSAEARRLGPVAIHLEQLIGREGLPVDEAIGVLRGRYGGAESPDKLQEIAQRLAVSPSRRFVGEEALTHLAAPGSAESSLLQRESKEASQKAAEALGPALAELSGEDRLILKMRFEDAFAIADIAATLRVEAKPLYRRLESILLGLRRRLEMSGVGPEAIETVFASGAPELRLDFAVEPGPRIDETGPSKKEM